MRTLAIWCQRRRRVVIGAWIVAVIVAGWAGSTAGSTYKSNFHMKGVDSQRANDLLRDRFPARSGDNASIVYRGGTIDETLRRVATLPHVTGVVPGRRSGDGRTAFATVLFDRRAQDLPKPAIQAVIQVAESARRPGLQVELGGQPIEFVERSSPGSATAIGLAAAIVILLVTFGSVVAMGLPVITALLALGTALGLIGLSTHIFDVAEFAPQLAAMIGLGVGIDYALFIVTRYRANLAAGLDVEEAVTSAMDTSGRAVLFAGLTVMIALLGQLVLGVPFLRGPAFASSLTVGLTMLASLTILPAILRTIGHRVDRLHVGRRPSPGSQGRLWERWSRAIQRRPVIAAALSAGMLVALALPVTALRLGSADAGTDPANTTTRKAYDMLAQGFGPGFNGPLQVAVETRPATARATIDTYARALRAEPGVVGVSRPAVNPSGTAAVVNVFPSTSPQAARTQDLLDRIRGHLLPPIERHTATVAYVGGITALFSDFSGVLARKLPLFIGVVVLISALLLLAVFRSVFVPIKAIVMNLLSFTATFGVVVAIFQWGWLGGLLGIDGTAPIAAFLPVMVFAIVFGLSMDYEVFLMSRIHEEWERTGDASESVVTGLSATGRVITAAAAIMVCVFGSFVLGDSLTIKLFGIGLGVAVFLDAVVIRSVLVPALMELAGRRAWWLPEWLNRRLPRVHVAVDGTQQALPRADVT